MLAGTAGRRQNSQGHVTGDTLLGQCVQENAKLLSKIYDFLGKRYRLAIFYLLLPKNGHNGYIDL